MIFNVDNVSYISKRNVCIYPKRDLVDLSLCKICDRGITEVNKMFSSQMRTYLFCEVADYFDSKADSPIWGCWHLGRAWFLRQDFGSFFVSINIVIPLTFLKFAGKKINNSATCARERPQRVSTRCPKSFTAISPLSHLELAHFVWMGCSKKVNFGVFQFDFYFLFIFSFPETK